MSQNNIEFVNSEVVVKCEYIKDDVSEGEVVCTFSTPAPNQNKCGEIFTPNNVDFVLCCAFCECSYNSIDDFGKHLRAKHANPHASFDNETCKIESDPEFTSDDLEFESNYDSSLSDEKLHREASYPCKYCYKQYKSKISLQRHYCSVSNDDRKTNEVVKSASGPVPAERSTSKVEKDGDIRHSLKDYTPETNSINLKVESEREPTFEEINETCEFCGQNLADILHICPAVKGDLGTEITHGAEAPNPDLFCDICHRQFKYKNVFRRHGMQHEVGPLALRKDPNYRKCADCGIKFSNNSEWLQHELNHPKIKPFQCSFCQKKFKTEIELEAHTKNHTIEGPVKCDQCGTDFVRYKNLISHINRVHLQLKPFACTLCDKKFPQNAELRVHMRRHTGEKPYQCEECGQSFMVATKLNEHLKRHAGIRDVQCPVCPMAFVTKKMLRKHMVKHSTERPHVCVTCGNTFSRRKALLAHAKIHLEVKEYVCNLCGKAFAQHAGLYMHKKTHLNE